MLKVKHVFKIMQEELGYLSMVILIIELCFAIELKFILVSKMNFQLLNNTPNI